MAFSPTIPSATAGAEVSFVEECLIIAMETGFENFYKTTAA